MVRDQMQDVLLVEVAEVVRGDFPGDASVDRGRTPRHPVRARGRGFAGLLRSRRLTSVGAGLLALLLAASATAGVQARARGDRLAALPGVLSPLHASLRELWRVPMRGWGQGFAVGDDIVLFGAADGGAAVVSLAGATGAQRWSAALGEVTPSDDVSCSPLGEPARYIVCQAQLTSTAGAGTASREAAVVAKLIVLDVATGDRLAERTLAGRNAAFAAIDGDLVVTEVLRDGRAQVSRQDPLTGDARWTFRSEEALRSAAGGSVWLYPRVQHGVIVANGPVTWALSAGGEVLGEWHLQGGDWAVRGGWGLDVSVLPDGRFAVGESGGVGLSDDLYGTVSTSDARDGYAISGEVLEPVVDDGSVADLLFTVPPDRGGLVAQELATGEKLWVLGNMPWGRAVVLDRRVIVVVGRELRGLDARSGDTLWSAPIPRGNLAQQVLTDGRIVVVPRTAPERGSELAAFDPADGREKWTAPLPRGANFLATFNGRLVAFTDHDLIVLG